VQAEVDALGIRARDTCRGYVEVFGKQRPLLDAHVVLTQIGLVDATNALAIGIVDRQTLKTTQAGGASPLALIADYDRLFLLPMTHGCQALNTVISSWLSDELGIETCPSVVFSTVELRSWRTTVPDLLPI